MNFPTVEFHPAPGEAIEPGDHASVPADLLLEGWRCGGCGHEVTFSHPTSFQQAVGPAMAHEEACPECPKPC